MKRLAIFCAVFSLLTVASARAERPIAAGLGLDAPTSPGELKTTPDMWFYQQAMRQYQDPKMAVRAQADLRARQRQCRLETMKWFGLSNSRPRVSSDPYNGDYSPGWVANPGYYPWRWSGLSQP
jgi:hypothetical protein